MFSIIVRDEEFKTSIIYTTKTNKEKDLLVSLLEYKLENTVRRVYTTDNIEMWEMYYPYKAIDSLGKFIDCALDFSLNNKYLAYRAELTKNGTEMYKLYYLKEYLVSEMGEIKYKTWLEYGINNFIVKEDAIIFNVEKEFHKSIIESQYLNILTNAFWSIYSTDNIILNVK